MFNDNNIISVDKWIGLMLNGQLSAAGQKKKKEKKRNYHHTKTIITIKIYKNCFSFLQKFTFFMCTYEDYNMAT